MGDIERDFIRKVTIAIGRGTDFSIVAREVRCPTCNRLLCRVSDAAGLIEIVCSRCRGKPFLIDLSGK
jgi:hypothetical protein